MTLAEYTALPYERQLVAVLNRGAYLARRYEPTAAVNLYHLYGRFFVEVFYDPRANDLTGLRAFAGPDGLAAYAALVTLPPDGGA